MNRVHIWVKLISVTTLFEMLYLLFAVLLCCCFDSSHLEDSPRPLWPELLTCEELGVWIRDHQRPWWKTRQVSEKQKPLLIDRMGVNQRKPSSVLSCRTCHVYVLNKRTHQHWLPADCPTLSSAPHQSDRRRAVLVNDSGTRCSLRCTCTQRIRVNDETMSGTSDLL